LRLATKGLPSSLTSDEATRRRGHLELHGHTGDTASPPTATPRDLPRPAAWPERSTPCRPPQERIDQPGPGKEGQVAGGGSAASGPPRLLDVAVGNEPRREAQPRRWCSSLLESSSLARKEKKNRGCGGSLSPDSRTIMLWRFLCWVLPFRIGPSL
jgi:hypothetical protein